MFVVIPSSGSKKPMPVGFVAASMCDGSKSPKTVKAAVLPVLLIASRLSAGLPPPVAGSSEVNAKLVGVERAARAAWDTQVDPGMQEFGLNSPGLPDPLRRVLVAAQAKRLVVDRPQAFGSGVRSGKKRQPFEELLALVGRGIRVYQRG